MLDDVVEVVLGLSDVSSSLDSRDKRACILLREGAQQVMSDLDGSI